MNGVLALFIAGASLASPREAKDLRISLVDDLGRSLTEPATVWQITETGDRHLLKRGTLSIDPAEMRGEQIVVEGVRHGPTATSAADLDKLAQTTRRLVIPRKMRVTASLSEHATVKATLFRQCEPDLKRPVLEAAIKGEFTTWVPSDDYLLVVSDKGFAPELRLVPSTPGAPMLIEQPRAKGWSVVLEVSAGKGDAVSGARVRLTAPPQGLQNADTPPRAEMGREFATNATNGHGLAVFSGIGERYATAFVSAAGYAPRESRGIVAAPGTYTLTRVTVPAAAELIGQITLDGAPARGFLASLLIQPETEATSKVVPRTWSETRSNEEGSFRFGGLPPNEYTLRIVAPDASLAEDRRVTVLEGGRYREEIRLVPIRIDGSVRRAGKAVPGATLDLMRLSPDRSHDAEGRARSTADGDGHYEATVYIEDTYYVSVLVNGAPADSKRVVIGRTGATVDFDLNEEALEGIVVDKEDHPLEDVAALMEFPLRTLRTVGRTGADGTFRVDVSGEGRARLWAVRAGGARSEDVFVDVPPPPSTRIKLVLDGAQLHGRLLLSDGTPLASGTVGAIDAAAAMLLDLVQTDARGEFRLVMSPRSIPTLFISGPGCPLGVRRASADFERPIDLQCAPSGAGINLRIVSEDEHGVPAQVIRLRTESAPVPDRMLLRHLWQLGLPGRTDGDGRLLLFQLESSSWDLFLGAASSDFTVATGMPDGYLTSLRLLPGEVAETTIQVKVSRLPEVSR